MNYKTERIKIENELLRKEFEVLQSELHKLIDQIGLTHKLTILKSQELDKVIAKIQKITKNYSE